MKKPVFITGTGTDVGKTLVAGILAKALDADYWKPVQAGINEVTDTEKIRGWLAGDSGKIHAESYKLQTPASPHIAARMEGAAINLKRIRADAEKISENNNRLLIVEGAGGLLVPLNETETVLDLIRMLNARVIIVSRNYLGSINHSLLTAKVLKNAGVGIMGWIFNDQYMHYEEEIAQWSGIPSIGSVPFTEKPDIEFINNQAQIFRPLLKQYLKD